MLEIFAVPGGSTLTNVLKSPWTTCCFFMLTNLVIYVDSLSREGFQKLWDEASKFQRLELWPSPRQPPTSHAGAAMVPRGSPNMEVDYFLPASTKASKQVGFNAIVGHQVTDALKLKKLFIGSVVLPKTLGSMSQRIDVLAFHELVLDAFAGASELFEALATSLNAGKSCLKYLRLLRLPEQGAGKSWSASQCFSYLSTVCSDFTYSAPMIPQSSLRALSTTARHLRLSFLSTGASTEMTRRSAGMHPTYSESPLPVPRSSNCVSTSKRSTKIETKAISWARSQAFTSHLPSLI
jgi:hypothetical protein